MECISGDISLYTGQFEAETNSRPFADDILIRFELFFWYENCHILIYISLEFVPNDLIDNTSSVGLNAYLA